jgi:hypothetical protein
MVREPKKVKHPYKFDAEKQKAYCENLAHGVGRVRSAKAIGISFQTICDYMETDRHFARMCKEAEEDANEAIVDANWQAAASGDIRAIDIWRKHASVETKKIIIGGDQENPVKVEVTLAEKLKRYEVEFAALEEEDESK